MARSALETGTDRGSLEASPAYRVVWEPAAPVDLFDPAPVATPAAVRAVMDGSLAVVRRHADAGTLYDRDGVVAAAVISGLAEAGYWGLRAGRAHGGSGASFADLASFITEMAAVDGWVAGLASAHACIGPVNLLELFGTADQKDRLLPALARGERLGAFAVTEPGAASDWGAMRTTAERHGDTLLITGEKLFITNAAPGRTLGVVCRLDGVLRMAIVELPDEESSSFRTVRYTMRAPSHCVNRGLVFDRLAVPAANVLPGDGRRIAFRALNHGRVAVCANAAGLLRSLAGSLLPWVRTRQTFGAAIGSRELVQRRLGRLAARIVGCDAMAAWGAALLDRGYRGELECVTAKVVGSEALKDATVDVLLRTHGARALLAGNLFADAVHDLLAPVVYEGENEILTLGFFGSLVRRRVGGVPAEVAGEGRDEARSDRSVPGAGAVPLALADQAAWAEHALRQLGHEIDGALRAHGPAMAARQAAAFDLARRVQDALAMLVVARYGTRQPDERVRDAAACLAAEIGYRLTGARPAVRHDAMLTELGAAVVEDRFAPTTGTARPDVAMPLHIDRYTS